MAVIHNCISIVIKIIRIAVICQRIGIDCHHGSVGLEGESQSVNLRVRIPMRIELAFGTIHFHVRDLKEVNNISNDKHYINKYRKTGEGERTGEEVSVT